MANREHPSRSNSANSGVSIDLPLADREIGYQGTMYTFRLTDTLTQELIAQVKSGMKRQGIDMSDMAVRPRDQDSYTNAIRFILREVAKAYAKNGKLTVSVSN